MSVYNGDKFLSSSIESILNQTYSDFELLILDDGSTDNTSKILNNYQNHQKIRLFKNNQNIGLTKSLNLLINKSKGSYIARQDCDDLSDSKRLENQLSFLLKHIEICFFLLCEFLVRILLDLYLGIILIIQNIILQFVH